MKMKRKPLFLPLAVLITTIILGFSVPAIFLANRSSQANYTDIDPTPTTQVGRLSNLPVDRDTDKVEKQNCTYHAYHWGTRPDAWPAQVTLGGVTYSRADMLSLHGTPEGDPAIDLLKEALIAIVNVYNGASQTRIEGILVEVDNWLSNHQADGELSQFIQQQARSYTSILANYNNGRLFPISCADQMPLPVTELASEEDAQSDSAATASPDVTGIAGAGEGKNPSGSVVKYEQPAEQPTPTDVPPAPPAVQQPENAPVAPLPDTPPHTVPPAFPPGNPDNDRAGRGNGNDNQGRGNGNGNGNQGKENDHPGQGNQGRGNDNPGQSDQGDKGKDKDKDVSDKEKGDSDKGKDKDKGNSGKGNGKKP